MVVPGHGSPAGSLGLGVLGWDGGTAARSHQLRQFRPRGAQALRHPDPGRVGAETLAQAGGAGGGRYPVGQRLPG